VYAGRMATKKRKQLHEWLGEAEKWAADAAHDLVAAEVKLELARASVAVKPSREGRHAVEDAEHELAYAKVAARHMELARQAIERVAIARRRRTR
jgi:hypothetical protein